jgi:Fibronectin type III domain
MAASEHSGRSRRVGPFVTVGTVVVVLAAACVTLFGLGAFDRAVAVYNPTDWLFSQVKGELGRVNGTTAKVDTRVKVNGTAGHHVDVSQSDRYLVVRDTDTGVVSALDLTTLQIAGSLDTTAGVGVRVVVHGSDAYVIDSVHGDVRRIDPLTLSPIGPPVSFAPGLVGGDFDSDGKLWLALPREGTVVSLAAGQGQAAPVVHTAPVTEPSHELAVSVLDKGVAVLDQTADQLVTYRDDKVVRTPLSLDDQALVAARTSGEQVPVTLPVSRRVDAVGDRSVSTLSVPGSGNGLSPAVAWSGWFYIADNRAGVVYVLNAMGSMVDLVRFTGTSDIELQVKDDYLYINAVDTGTAQVVDRGHKRSPVDKYPNNVPGGDPPPVPPTPPSPPAPPPVTAPGPPGTVVASAGNATVHLTWGPAAANGAKVLRYVVEGAGKSVQVGADQRVLDVTGLTNGQTYTFTVYAVNARGSGPKRASNPVVPTSDVPDPPASVTAKESVDGSVTVTWPVANGQGHQVANYQVTAVGPAGPVKTWQVAGDQTTLTSPALPDLAYGTQYAFTVTTVNDKGAGSKASPLSNAVVPYAAPAAPGSLRATTGSQAGVVHVAWAAPAANGRPIQKYQVSYSGKTLDVTGGTAVDLTGLGDGERVAVSVVAINAAGPGKTAGPVTAAAIAKPTVTMSGARSDHNSITANFTVNDGGGAATCGMSVSGAGSANGACSSITIGGLAPGVGYTFTVTVTNQAGGASANGSGSTVALYGVVTCVSTDGYCNSGVGIYSRPIQDSSAETNWDGHNGRSYQAYCKATGGDGNQQASATLHAAGYNNNKVSDQWVRISAPGAAPRYIPWIWFNMNPDDLALLPVC